MPAVFNVTALLQPQTQTIGMPQAAKSLARLVPPGQAQANQAQTAPSAAAPNGAGAPMATGAVLPPSAQLPVPAPPPVVSTSQTGKLAAAAINGLDRTPDDRPRNPHQGAHQHDDSHQHDGSDTPAAPVEPQQTDADAPPPSGLPGGPAPSPTGRRALSAAPGYIAALFVTRG